MKLTEKQIESQILTWLNHQPGVFAFKINTVGIWDPTKKLFRRNKNPHVHKGTSDIMGLKNGQFFAIEVKTSTTIKKPSPEQISFLGTITKQGGKGIFACCLNDVIAFMGMF